jgi:hypothetical protein
MSSLAAFANLDVDKLITDIAAVCTKFFEQFFNDCSQIAINCFQFLDVMCVFSSLFYSQIYLAQSNMG